MHETELVRWSAQRCPPNRSSHPAVVEEFDRILSDAQDESTLQTFLASHPSLLGPLASPGGTYWCLDRPRLGAELIPDFLLASYTSAGFAWVMIELEGPNERILTKSGLPARKLAEALKQVRDWRAWLKANVGYARDQLGLRGIDAEGPAYILIGRRSGIHPKQADVYRALSDNRTVVMTYDRLRDLIGRRSNCQGAALD